MRHVTQEQLTDILEIMNIKQSIDSGFVITHHGDLDGQQIIAISTCRGDGIATSWADTNADLMRKQRCSIRPPERQSLMI